MAQWIFPVACINPRAWYPAPGQRFGASRAGGRRRHKGVDISAPRGTPVLAPLDGTVTRLGNAGGITGIRVWLIKTIEGSFFFCHLDFIPTYLKEGMFVRAGTVIGYVGTTGGVRSPHLHFSWHPWGSLATPADPLGKLKAARHSGGIALAPEPAAVRYTPRVPGPVRIGGTDIVEYDASPFFMHAAQLFGVMALNLTKAAEACPKAPPRW